MEGGKNVEGDSVTSNRDGSLSTGIAFKIKMASAILPCPIPRSPENLPPGTSAIIGTHEGLVFAKITF
jgi:hypothetical protein